MAFAAALSTPLALAGTAGASPAVGGTSHGSARVCAVPAHGYAACSALVRVNGKGQPAATSAPSGYGPGDLESAYSLPSATAGSGQTIAIVDA